MLVITVNTAVQQHKFAASCRINHGLQYSCCKSMRQQCAHEPHVALVEPFEPVAGSETQYKSHRLRLLFDTATDGSICSIESG